MITKVQTIEDLKEMFIEVVLNHTNKVTKVNEASTMNAIAFGNAKLAQKAMAQTAVLETHLFPDVAFGKYLDQYARLNGIGQRFGAKQSSTFVMVVADPGTIYIPTLNNFTSTSGIIFEIERVYTVGIFGFGYIKVRSQATGFSANVDAFTINSVTNPPGGHRYCVNEYAAQYGSDIEDDEVLRKRVKEGVDLLSRGTISMLEQAFMKINENVLKIFYTGRNELGKSIISVLSVNGIDFTDSELNDIIIRSEKYLNISEMRSVDGGGQINMVLKNVDWQFIDISFRCEVEQSYNANEVRKDVQIRLSKYLDYRFWKVGQRVQWDDMMQIVKSTEGIRYVNDAYFYPRTDIEINPRKLPRIRGFQMLDSNGKIMQDFQGNLNPIYYPNQIDFGYQSSVLQSI